MIEGTGTIGVEFSGSGFALSDNSRPPKLFKIVSGTNPYRATPLVLNESDGSTPSDGNTDILAVQKALYEVNGVTTVPANTVVAATPNPHGTGWYFQSPSASYAHNGGSLSAYSVTGSYTSVYTQSLAAGTWAVWYSLTGSMYGAVGIYLQARVTDGTTPAALTRFGMTQVANVYTTETAAGCHVYTLASAGSISLQVSHTGAPTFVSLSAGSLLSMKLA